MGNDDAANYESQCYRLILLAKDFLPDLERTLNRKDLSAETYAIRRRAKSERRVLDKIQFKRKSRPDYGLKDVTDIIGIRFISLYRGDLTKVVKSILELIYDETGQQGNYFSNASIVELKSYTSNSIPEQDPVNIELKKLYEPSYSEKSGVSLELIAQSRYSSVHMVLKTTLEAHDGVFTIPIEIQFRSVFEDAWAEIDHKALYELGRYNEKVDPVKREAILQHMTVLKKIVDTAADYADVIRKTIISPVERDTTIQRNLDGVDYISELARIAKLPNDLIEKLSLSVSQKISLDKQIEEGIPSKTSKSYLDIANNLKILHPLVVSSASGGSMQSQSSIDFAVRMEEALCRLLSDVDGQLQIAIDSYIAITEKFPEHPAGWFRLAQANQQLSDSLDPNSITADDAANWAFKQYGKSLECLDKCLNMATPKRIFIIAPDQERYIAANAARLQGFVKWRLSDRRRKNNSVPPTESDVKDCLLAYQAASSGLKAAVDPGQRYTLANNAAYFAWDAVNSNDVVGLPDGAMPKIPDMLELLKILTSDEVAPERKDNIRFLDTLVRAYLFVGDKEKAAQNALRILNIDADTDTLESAKRVSAYRAESTRRAVKYAWKVWSEYSNANNGLPPKGEK